MNDGYRCQLCGAWIEIRNLTMVLAHEGPLPHVEQDRTAVANATGRKRRPRRSRVRLNQSGPPASNQKDETEMNKELEGGSDGNKRQTDVGSC